MVQLLCGCKSTSLTAFLLLRLELPSRACRQKEVQIYNMPLTHELSMWKSSDLCSLECFYADYCCKTLQLKKKLVILLKCYFYNIILISVLTTMTKVPFMQTHVFFPHSFRFSNCFNLVRVMVESQSILENAGNTC